MYSIVLPLLYHHINEIMQYLISCLASFSQHVFENNLFYCMDQQLVSFYHQEIFHCIIKTMSCLFTHLIRIFFSFLRSILLSVPRTFLHKPFGRHMFSFLLSKSLGAKLLGQMHVEFIRKYQFVFQSICIILLSYLQTRKVQVAPCTCQRLVLSVI